MIVASPLALLAAVAVPNQVSEVTATAAMAGVKCVISVNKKGADRSRFAGNQSWVSSSDGMSFQHRSMPITVTFPKDNDGIARICEVRATLPSQADQAALKSYFERSLISKPLEQGDSTIWMFDANEGARGLQFFPDKTSDHPKVRLIGAAF